jgi:thioredoxin-like negative regulator of GroEL
MKSKDYTDDVFWDQVGSDSHTFLAFWSHTCPPCKVMAPVFERLGKRFRGSIEFVAVSTYDRPDMAKRFGISSTPTFVLARRGKAVRRFYGVIREQTLAEELSKYAPPTAPPDTGGSGLLAKVAGIFRRN